MRKRKTQGLGELLSRTRQESGRTREEVAAQAGVSTQFATDVEAGRFRDAPQDVYTDRGIRRYAAELGVEEAASETRPARNRGTPSGAASFSRPLQNRHKLAPLVTSSIARRGIIGVVAAIVVIYVGYQVITSLSQPPLEVAFPRENQVIYTNQIELVGVTEPGNNVAVDGQPVPVAEDGNFRHVLTLPEGRHSLNIRAENDLGRTSRLTRHFRIEDESD